MWTEELFNVEKPVIALLHLRALPGDPMFDAEKGLEYVEACAKKELEALQKGGVDGILIANEFSLPYQHKAPAVTLSAMAYVIGRIRSEISVPFGVNVVLNPLATVEMGAALGAAFVRNTFTGAYIGESGITDTDPAAYVRRRTELGRPDLKMLFKVNPESDTYIAPRDIKKITKSIIFHDLPDGLCVSGASAGSETDTGLIEEVRSVAGNIPVFANTGCTAQNICRMLSVCDGALVGTAFKAGGFNGFADYDKVREFMDIVKDYRKAL
jgi:membrane complex biogenesis BtpA family protein